MATKEYIQLFALILTIISSHSLVSRQIRKNKKSAWIEDLRKEVATYTACGMTITPKFIKEELFTLSKSASIITLLLDEENELQNKLIVEIAATTTILVEPFSQLHVEQFSKKNAIIIKLTKEIIREKTKQL